MASYPQTSIIQRPRQTFNDGTCFTPVGLPLIFTVENQKVVADELRVKYVAKVFYSDSDTPQTGSSLDLIGVFKTTPNNEGSGVFDMSPIFANFLSAENTGVFPVQFDYASNVTYLQTDRLPIHLIDNYSTTQNSIKYFRIQFRTEWLDQTTNTIVSTGTAVNTDTITVFNGYVKHSEEITIGAYYSSGAINPNQGGPLNSNLGYRVHQFKLDDDTRSLLTNAPLTQQVNIEDYGTMAMLMIRDVYSASNLTGPYKVKFQGVLNGGSSIADHNVIIQASNGAYSAIDQGKVSNKMLFFGCGPANLRRTWSAFSSNIYNMKHYTVKVEDISGNNLSQTYRYDINCFKIDNSNISRKTKGYEPIRLCWLNQYGAWDYYTFTMKSTRTIKTKGTTFRPLAGQWNKRIYTPSTFRGGKKTLRVNAREVIKMNTDFIDEENSTWLEELISSPEIYILQGFNTLTDTTILDTTFNQFVTPVRLLTSSHQIKTEANDKLIQYTFEVEKTKELRTQSV